MAHCASCKKIVINSTQQHEMLKGPWTPKLTYDFPKKAHFSDNFDSNIGTQRFVNTKKLTFEIDNLQQ